MAHPKPASPNEPKVADEAAHPTAAAGAAAGGGAKDVAAAPAGTPIEAAAAAASAASPAVNSPPAKARSDAPTATPIEAAQEPTYFSVRSSSAYSTARRLLAAGRFEDALTLLEAAIAATRSALPPVLNSAGEEIDELHPALAPLHYLYGTTLLYSVEESDDMVNGAAAAAGAQGGAQGSAGSEEMAEDLQIAWENLDLARTIVEVRGLVGPKERELATSASTSTSNTATDADDAASNNREEEEIEIENARTLLLDLAQIHLRLADLQKANSAYRECLADYARALELRRAVLGPYDRRVADVHYQLGVVCMTRAAEGGDATTATTAVAATASASASSGLLPPGTAQDGLLGMMAAAASEAAAEAQAEARPTAEECRELRERSVRHYLACARCFGGCLAKLCGIDEDEQIEDMVGKIQAVEEVGGADNDGDKKMPAIMADGKKVGGADDKEEEDGAKHEHRTYADASQTLAGIRARCAELAGGAANAKKSPSAEDMEVVADLLSLLDELQETIDSQEEDLRGVHEVQAMKARIEEEAQAADADPFGAGGGGGAAGAAAASVGGADGGVTTIGFGQPSAAAAATATSAAVAAGTGEAARPMMVVKKKKKKRAALAPADGSGAARPAAEAAKPAAEPDAKRAKTE